MRLRYRAPQSPSRLEERFLMLRNHVKGPDLEREFRLHHERLCEVQRIIGPKTPLI